MYCAALHRPSDDVMNAHDKLCLDIKVVVSHIASCLALWPAPSVVFSKNVRLNRRKTKQGTGHVLTWVGEAWKCVACCGRFRTRPQHKCPGESQVFSSILEKDRGHKLWGSIASDGALFVYCNGCGCGSTAKGRGLYETCRGPVPGSFGVNVALRKIRQGKHPWKDLRLGKPWRLVLNASPPCEASQEVASRSSGALPVVAALDPDRVFGTDPA